MFLGNPQGTTCQSELQSEHWEPRFELYFFSKVELGEATWGTFLTFPESTFLLWKTRGSGLVIFKLSSALKYFCDYIEQWWARNTLNKSQLLTPKLNKQTSKHPPAPRRLWYHGRSSASSPGYHLTHEYAQARYSVSLRFNFLIYELGYYSSLTVLSWKSPIVCKAPLGFDTNKILKMLIISKSCKGNTWVHFDTFRSILHPIKLTDLLSFLLPCDPFYFYTTEQTRETETAKIQIIPVCF